ncbi:MAG: hypothetical protein ABR518_08750 [Actinomycetota bacterium]
MNATTAAASIAAASVASLWAISVAEWVRTAGLRRGRPPREPAIHRSMRTSSVTWLPAAAGAAIAGLGAATLSDPWRGCGLILSGGGIAAAGVVTRVTAVEAGPDAIVIRYLARSAFRLPWNECRAVVPPRWPLGGWRVLGHGRGRALMPSDLFRHEDVLATVVQAAGLRFRDGAWRRPPG